MIKTDQTPFPLLLSAIFKSTVVGRVLMSKLLRSVFSIPGVAIDQVIGVLFPEYLKTTKDSIHDFDANRLTFFTGLFGGLGDIIGRGIGWGLGLLVGIVLFIPDLILVSAVNVYRAFCRVIPILAQEFGGFSDNLLCWHKNPKNWFEYFANLASVFIGIPLVLAPFLVFRSVEFFIPGHLAYVPSSFFLVLGASIGAGVGYLFGLVAIPALYSIGKITEGYDLFREGIRSFVAVVYAKNNMTVLKHSKFIEVRGKEGDSWQNDVFLGDYSDKFISENIHSNEFRIQVEALRSTTWTQLILGVFAQPESKKTAVEVQPTAPVAAVVGDDSLLMAHAEVVSKNPMPTNKM